MKITGNEVWRDDTAWVTGVRHNDDRRRWEMWLERRWQALPKGLGPLPWDVIIPYDDTWCEPVSATVTHGAHILEVETVSERLEITRDDVEAVREGAESARRRLMHEGAEFAGGTETVARLKALAGKLDAAAAGATASETCEHCWHETGTARRLSEHSHYEAYARCCYCGAMGMQQNFETTQVPVEGHGPHFTTTVPVYRVLPPDP